MSRIIKAEVGVMIMPTEALIIPELNNYFIIHIRFIPTSYKFNYFDKMLELLASVHYSQT